MSATQPDAALSYLFVPGNRPERFARALASGADCVVIDLEDAVSPADKAQARTMLAEWWAASPDDRARCMVRVNPVGTPEFAADMALLRTLASPGVMLAKAESGQQVRQLREARGDGAAPDGEPPLLPLIESALGVHRALEMAQAPGVVRLAFGAIDFAVDLDLPPDSAAADQAAVMLALASRVAGLPPPVAGVTPAIDAAQVRADWLRERSLGMGAKLCIHPLQVAALHEAARPADEQLVWARRVLAAVENAGDGAIQVDGRMVDRPLVVQARRIVERAART